jgi:hypothetical protein
MDADTERLTEADGETDADTEGLTDGLTEGETEGETEEDGETEALGDLLALGLMLGDTEYKLILKPIVIKTYPSQPISTDVAPSFSSYNKPEELSLSPLFNFILLVWFALDVKPVT